MRFNELNIAVGKKMTLKMLGQDYKKHQLDVQVLGFDEGKHVLITVVSKPGQVLLRPSQIVSLEASLAHGNVQFEAAIESVVESPFLYLVVEYPVSVDFKPQRSFPRVAVDTEVEVTGYTGLGMTTSTINGYMLDVSRGGARLVLDKELTSMVTKISLGVMLSVADLERDMELTAKLRSVAELSTSHPQCGFAYGVEFMAPSITDELFIRSFCAYKETNGSVLLCPSVSK